MHQCIKFILFWRMTLYMYTQQQAYVKQTLVSACFLADSSMSDKCLLLYVQSWTPDDGRKDRQNM
jgi:hypothetical protein